jgi:hypothetical protein
MMRVGDGGSGWAAVDAVSEHYWVLHGLMAVEWDGTKRGAVRRSVVQAARFKLRCSFDVTVAAVGPGANGSVWEMRG